MSLFPRTTALTKIDIEDIEPSAFEELMNSTVSQRQLADQYLMGTAHFNPQQDPGFRSINAFMAKNRNKAFGLRCPEMTYGGDLAPGGQIALDGREVGAWMADGYAGTISDADLITNGDFATDISGWTDQSIGTGSIAWNASGYMELTSTDISNRGKASQAITTVVGQSYQVTYTTINTELISVYIGNAAVNAGLGYKASFAVETVSIQFTATATTTYITINGPTTAATSGIDDISCSPITFENSVAKYITSIAQSASITPMKVVGSLTTTAVNTGAGLVGYSNWSNSNYLKQIYNSDLDYGTGSFFISGFFKDAQASDFIFDRGTGANDRFYCAVDASGYLTFVTNDGSNSSYIATDLGSVIGLTGWQFFCVIRNSDGTINIWLNDTVSISGVLTARNISSNNQPSYIGVSYALTSPFNGSLALLRTGPFAPTAAEIKRAYDLERILFDANEPLGSIPKVNGGSQTGSSIVADGYTASTLVHQAGDYINIGTDRKTYLVTDDVTSDSSGNATIPIYPPLYATPEDNASIRYDRAVVNVRTPKGHKFSAGYPQKYDYQLEWREDAA